MCRGLGVHDQTHTLRCTCVSVLNVTEDFSDAQGHGERRWGFIQVEASVLLTLKHPLSLSMTPSHPDTMAVPSVALLGLCQELWRSKP